MVRHGNRYWFFRFASRSSGKERRLGIGPLHTFSLAEAREKARQYRQALAEGRDPIDEKHAQQGSAAAAAAKGMTFDQCRDAYIEAHRAGWRNVKHGKQWTSSLETYVTPVFGRLPVAAIDTGMTLKVLEPHWADKTETMSRVRGRIESILDWARVRDYRDDVPNPARWKGHLDHLLPAKRKVAAVEHHAALDYRELPEFMVKLRAHQGGAARELEFIILTAARSGEALGARLEEFDLVAKTWTVPASRMKGGREHRVPLSDAAVQLVEQMIATRHSARLFPASAATLSSMPSVLGIDATVHGFRSAFSTWAAEQTAFSHEVREAALAHASADKVAIAYMRSDLFDRRRKLMQMWADYINSPAAAATVVPLRKEVPA